MENVFKPGQLLKISGAKGEWGMFIVLENISDNKIKLWTICAPKKWSHAVSKQTFDFEPQQWLDREEGETIEIVSEETASFNKTPKETNEKTV